MVQIKERKTGALLCDEEGNTVLFEDRNAAIRFMMDHHPIPSMLVLNTYYKFEEV